MSEYMTDQARKLMEYCLNNIPIQTETCEYKSLSVCILDCVYSLRARYYSTTIPVIDRYASRYMNNDRFSSGDSLTTFVNNINQCGGPEGFVDSVLQNRQKINGVLKSKICLDLAKKLLSIGVNTLDDFQNYENSEVLELCIRSVWGINDAGTNYLFMLAGDPNRCKPDVHIHHCIVDACGKDVSNIRCQELLTEVADMLKKQYPSITVRGLDYAIWEKYRVK